MPRRSTIAITALLLMGCEPRAEPVAGDRGAEREEAARRTCIAAELVRVSDEEIDTIESTLPADIETATPQMQTVWQAQISALQFAQTLYDHAQLRHASLAHADSALNRATSSADSARHMQMAARYTSLAPQAGTVEANVLNEYERRFARLRADEDHRCNWDL